jgi:hypothetical protein
VESQSRIASKFGDIGSRARLVRSLPDREFEIDIRRDGKGEFFRLSVPQDVGLEVLDLRPRDRHLLLMVRSEGKPRFLCGHDERHWFAAAIPRAISTVTQAKNALKPAEARGREARVRRKLRNRRRNPAYVRQGEWFFLPAPRVNIDEAYILTNEPLTRGRGSTPHVIRQAARLGGETVYVCPRFPEGVSEARYERFVRYVPESRGWHWQPQKRNPLVYARGRVTHPDHATIVLNGWHRVLMNTEGEAPARRFVAVID